MFLMLIYICIGPIKGIIYRLKNNFKYVFWVKILSRCQVSPAPKDMLIRTPLDSINKTHIEPT